MRKDAEKTEGSDLLVRLNKNYKTRGVHIRF